MFYERKEIGIINSYFTMKGSQTEVNVFFLSF